MKKEREYGIDALRIVSMLMVVTLHVLKQGGILSNLQQESIRYGVAWFLEAAAYGAVNCYGLISGYVGVNSRQRYSSILFLWLQVVFYSVIISCIMHCFMPQHVASNEWVKGFFPVSLKYYWYYTAYFLISFLIPLLNTVLHTASKEELFAGLAITVVLFSVNTIAFQQDIFLVNGGYSPLWLMMLYMIGGFIKLHGESISSYQWIKRHAGCLFLFGTVAAWGIKICMGSNDIPFIFDRKIPSGALYNYVSPAIVLSSVALFALFAGWKPRKWACKWIKLISPAAFGVYLIHVHPQIWKHCVKNAFVSFAYLKAYVLPFAVMGATFGIFIVCIVIELLRLKLFRILKVKEACQYLMNKVGLP